MCLYEYMYYLVCACRGDDDRGKPPSPFLASWPPQAYLHGLPRPSCPTPKGERNLEESRVSLFNMRFNIKLCKRSFAWLFTSPPNVFISAVKEFYQRNECVYVGEAAFSLAWAKINQWINFQSLMGHLMRNGLVNSASDMEDISSPYLPAGVRHTNLQKMLKTNGGNCGHFIFYMSLCDSLESNPLGHGDAVDELKRCGECSAKKKKGSDVEVCVTQRARVS